jgi:hypothetical protein
LLSELLLDFVGVFFFSDSLDCLVVSDILYIYDNKKYNLDSTFILIHDILFYISYILFYNLYFLQ